MPQDRLVTVDGKEYVLHYQEDNSAPCAGCPFLKFTREVRCTFPRDRHPIECSHELGTNKGWNTWQYRIRE